MIRTVLPKSSETLDAEYKKVMDKMIGPNVTELTGNINRTDFPKDFKFGCASSAYQFEGAASEGGRGPSIWDDWSHNFPDKITDGRNGDVAVDHYHMYKEDINLMKKTGFDAYRFSISWPRLLPGGRLNTGINREGIKHYNDVIDTLIAQGIEPCATLFHWDLPLSLELEYGGFLSEQFVNDFCEYAELCFWEFGDRVKTWITFNEPWTFTTYGYVDGKFPPGRGATPSPDSKFQLCAHKGASGISAHPITTGDPGTEPYIVAHNLLLAHAYAVDLYRQNFQTKQSGKIGITNVSNYFEPLTETVEDYNALKRALDFMLGWFVAPIATGDYPPSMRKAVGDRLPTFSSSEAKLIKGSYDFMGLNYYTSWYVQHTPKTLGDPVSYKSDQELVFLLKKNDVWMGDSSGVDWLMRVPRGIYNLVTYAKEMYNIGLIYITENGTVEANDTTLPLSKARSDPKRIKYFHSHMLYLQKAIQDGVNVKAYFIWSFGDNFEWSDGYASRFGIFYIDYLTGRLTRYPKTSALWWMNFLHPKLLSSSMKRQALEIEDEDDVVGKKAKA